MNMKSVASAILAAGMLSACNDVKFNPAGTWDFTTAQYAGSATYLNSEENVSVHYDLSDIDPMSMFPGILGIVITHNSAGGTVNFAGTDYPLTGRTAVLGNSEMPMTISNCSVVKYQHAEIPFNAAGTQATIRFASGFTLEDLASTSNCSDLLQAAKQNILMTGTIPSDLEEAVYLGVLKIAILDQARSFEVSEEVAGHKVSASQGADGSSTLDAEMHVDALNANVDAVLQALLKAAQN